MVLCCVHSLRSCLNTQFVWHCVGDCRVTLDACRLYSSTDTKSSPQAHQPSAGWGASPCLGCHPLQPLSQLCAAVQRQLQHSTWRHSSNVSVAGPGTCSIVAAAQMVIIRQRQQPQQKQKQQRRQFQVNQAAVRCGKIRRPSTSPPTPGRFVASRCSQGQRGSRHCIRRFFSELAAPVPTQQSAHVCTKQSEALMQ